MALEFMPIINVKIARKLAKKRHRNAIISLNHENAIWLFRHAKMGAEAWLKENPNENIMNLAFYRDRVNVYHQLCEKCEKAGPAPVEFSREINL